MNEWVAARGAERTVQLDGFVTCPRCQRAFPAHVALCSVDGARLVPAPRPGSAADAAEELAPGTVVAEYVIEAAIGRGGMGTVYRAVQPVIGSRVAVKVLALDRLTDHQAVSRFVQEARTANQIRHRNIVDVFTFGRLPDGRVYCVMEYLDGVSLHRQLADHGPMSLAGALRVLDPIARALDAAHAKGVVHRDIKPANIFLVREQEQSQPALAKLLDFGIAKLIGEPAAVCDVRTETGVMIGTPAYMAPEQFRGKDVGPRADIYGLGAVAYQMLTGALPYRGDNHGELMYQQHTELPVAPSQLEPTLPPAVDAVLLRALHRDADQRPERASDLVAALVDAAGRWDEPPEPPAPALTARSLWQAAAIGIVAIASGVAVALWPGVVAPVGAPDDEPAPVAAPAPEPEPPPPPEPEPPPPEPPRTPTLPEPPPPRETITIRIKKAAPARPKPAAPAPRRPRQEVVPDMPVKF